MLQHTQSHTCLPYRLVVVGLPSLGGSCHTLQRSAGGPWLIALCPVLHPQFWRFRRARLAFGRGKSQLNGCRLPLPPRSRPTRCLYGMCLPKLRSRGAGQTRIRPGTAVISRVTSGRVLSCRLATSQCRQPCRHWAHLGAHHARHRPRARLPRPLLLPTVSPPRHRHHPQCHRPRTHHPRTRRRRLHSRRLHACLHRRPRRLRRHRFPRCRRQPRHRHRRRRSLRRRSRRRFRPAHHRRSSALGPLARRRGGRARTTQARAPSTTRLSRRTARPRPRSRRRRRRRACPRVRRPPSRNSRRRPRHRGRRWRRRRRCRRPWCSR